MKVILSGGQFGGQTVDWPTKAKIVSLFHENEYWNYDVEIHKDSATRADFCGTTAKESGTVLTALVE